MSDSGQGSSRQKKQQKIFGSFFENTSNEFQKKHENIPRAAQYPYPMVAPRRFSGEIVPGEQVSMDEVVSGQREQNEKLKKRLIHERKLWEEEKVLIESKSRELRIQLHAVTEEVQRLAISLPELDQGVKIAAMQAPANPGVYHVYFFERLLTFIKDFRMKIQDASVWLNATNKRADKKNYWARYKKQGAKFLLSGEHYLTRSAG